MPAASVRVCSPIALDGGRLAGRTPDFVCAYELAPAPAPLSPERWARAAWEESPFALRLLMVFGWRFVLGLRLGKLNSPDHILGWSIEESSDQETVCHLSSWYLDAYNSFRSTPTGLVWTTTVLYRRPVARVVWPPVSLLHRPLVRLALRGAARRAAPRIA